MRQLVSCRSCSRQYHAGALVEGSRFRCRCGEIVRVPAVESRDAAVVRCSACGAPRRDGADSCGFCGADFTLAELSLGTICPSCTARVSDRARFCHGCGTPITPEEVAGSPTDKPCPACGRGHSLHSRKLGQEALSVLECSHCAGIWLGDAALEVLLDRSRRSSASSESGHGGPPPVLAPNPAERVVYRPCPDCAKRMNRRNWGRTSGVIVDGCKGHGVWFDHDELEATLRWVRSGGESRSHMESAEQERELERGKRLGSIILARRLEDAEGTSSSSPVIEALVKLVDWFEK